MSRPWVQRFLVDPVRFGRGPWDPWPIPARSSKGPVTWRVLRVLNRWGVTRRLIVSPILAYVDVLAWQHRDRSSES